MYRLLSLFLFMGMLLLPQEGALFSSPESLMNKGAVLRGPRGHHGSRGPRGHQGHSGGEIYHHMDGSLFFAVDPSKIERMSEPGFFLNFFETWHFVIITPDQHRLVVDVPLSPSEKAAPNKLEPFMVKLRHPYVMNGTYVINLVFDVVGSVFGLNETEPVYLAAKKYPIKFTAPYALVAWYEPTSGVGTLFSQFTVAAPPESSYANIPIGQHAPAMVLSFDYTLFKPGDAFQEAVTPPITSPVIKFPEN
jgi:hypothetical protein